MTSHRDIPRKSTIPDIYVLSSKENVSNNEVACTISRRGHTQSSRSFSSSDKSSISRCRSRRVLNLPWKRSRFTSGVGPKCDTLESTKGVTGSRGTSVGETIDMTIHIYKMLRVQSGVHGVTWLRRQLIRSYCMRSTRINAILHGNFVRPSWGAGDLGEICISHTESSQTANMQYDMGCHCTYLEGHWDQTLVVTTNPPSFWWYTIMI